MSVSRVLSSLLFCAQATLASASLPNSFLAYEYSRDDYDYLNAQGSSHRLLGSWELSRQMFLLASYGWSETEDFAFDRISGSIGTRDLGIGLGVNLPIGGGLNLLPSLHYLNSRADYRGGFSGNPDIEDDGYLLEFKFRQELREDVELLGGYRRSHLYDRDDNSLFIGGIVYPVPRLGMGARYLHTDLGANYPGARSDRYSSLALILQFNLQ